MSKKRNPDAVDHSFRRTWNKADYVDDSSDQQQSEMTKRRRTAKFGAEAVSIDARAGSSSSAVELGADRWAGLAASAAGGGDSAGFRCEACDRVLKDSNAWLDHINSEGHQRAVGVGRAQVATVDQVKQKLEQLSGSGGPVKESASERLRRLAGKGGAEAGAGAGAGGGGGQKKRTDSQPGSVQRKPSNKEHSSDQDETKTDAADATTDATAADEEDKSDELDEEQKMLAMMGLPVGFGSTSKK